MAEKFGRPQIIINFKSKATTAINRSGRGVGVMILNDENAEDKVTTYTIIDVTEIPTTLTARNVDLIKKALLGTPSKLFVYVIPPQTKTTTSMQEIDDDGDPSTPTVSVPVQVNVDSSIQQADALKNASTIKFNYICHPTGTAQDQNDLAEWVKSQRRTKNKTVKGIVANVDADSYGVINFTTGNIRVVNSEYTDALIEAEGIVANVPADIEHYITYTAAEYTARILGVACGITLDRSMTYYELSEVVDCDVYDDVDEHINNGELCLIDEGDGNGVKIARGCNSLHTFTTDIGQDFRYIKNVETVDLITDDIREIFRADYLGKVLNDYDHKMLFIAAILVYFEELKGNILDNSSTAVNTVDIDFEKNRDYAKLKVSDISQLSDQEIREFNTGTNVFLDGSITPVNAMEDLHVNFVL